MPDKKTALLPGQIIEGIEGKIYSLRGQRVMLSHDLAALYQVETKVLMQAVRRNIERFPEDFSFKLTNQEVRELRSQFVTLEGGLRTHAPHAFTEQGVAMHCRADEPQALSARFGALFGGRRYAFPPYKKYGVQFQKPSRKKRIGFIQD